MHPHLLPARDTEYQIHWQVEIRFSHRNQYLPQNKVPHSQVLLLFQWTHLIIFSVSSPFQLWCNTDWPHRHNRNFSSIICFDYSLYKHILTNQLPVFLHNKIKFRNKCVILSPTNNFFVNSSNVVSNCFFTSSLSFAPSYKL